MNLLQLIDKLNIELSDIVSIYDMNLKSCPLFIGLCGHIPFELLRRELKGVDFQEGKAQYKSNEMYYKLKFVLK